MLAAWLAENGRDTERDQLMARHLLPWSTRFLSVFVENAAHPFYTALGKLAQLTLAEWQSTLLIPIAEKRCTDNSSRLVHPLCKPGSDIFAATQIRNCYTVYNYSTGGAKWLLKQNSWS